MSTIRRTVSFKNLSDVLSGLGFTDEETEHVIEVGFSNVSWGDAAYTLIGNNFALNNILDGLPAYDADRLSNIISRYWELVGQDDFINMEG